MNIKPRTYYKYHTFNDQDFDIIYTGNKWVYIVAEKYGTSPLEKRDKRIVWDTIKEWQLMVNRNMYKITELSKDDLFLELL